MRNTLQVDVEWKAGSSPGEIEGYAAVFGNVDKIGDVVQRGAFTKTINDWRKARTPMPLTADHDITAAGVIGSVTHLSEDSRGLRFKARLARTAKAQDVRSLILDGHLKGTSFTYEIIRSARGRLEGKAVRLLQELRLFELTVSPIPINDLAGVTGAKASTRPWSDFTAADYTPEQYRRACLIDTGEGEVDSKDRYKLPVREPGGALNVNGVHAAAGALAGARGGMSVSAEDKRSAARKLIRLYGEIGEEPPDSLRALAGGGSASFVDWVDSMEHAFAIKSPWARKAAVDELVGSYPADDIQPEIETDPSAASEDAPGTDGGAATGEETGDTPTPDTAYAESFLHGPPDGAPDREPPQALPGPIADLELARFNEEIAAVEAEINQALGKDPTS